MNAEIDKAAEAITPNSIMRDFAASTGLTNAGVEPRRYLWTDAFAVCNYLGLYRQTGAQDQLHLALKLVDQVHQTLGRHHKDSLQTGWISGLEKEQGHRHPTKGGLRIGKKLNERQADEPYDENREWDRDGQYFHYLTKWMHALNRVSEVTGEGMYNRWALELGKAAHAAFTYTAPDGRKRMYWKMSIDFTRPLVDSMGHHDPLDGLITYKLLQATSKKFVETATDLRLTTEIQDMATMCEGRDWVTQDALGLGGLLSDANKLFQLIANHQLDENTRLELLLNDIGWSLDKFVEHNRLNIAMQHRLAFRELGLAIGLQGIERMQETLNQHPDKFSQIEDLKSQLSELAQFNSISDIINNFWLKPAHRSLKNWLDHADINNVMLATSLAPDGYL
jgi:hypothetical protein